jgi:hypothetical protein
MLTPIKQDFQDLKYSQDLFWVDKKTVIDLLNITYRFKSCYILRYTACPPRTEYSEFALLG